MRSLKLIGIILVIIIFASPVQADGWTSVCGDPDYSYCNYCDNVGKSALNNFTNPSALRGVKIGKIVGVAWRPKGSVISPSGASSVRVSPRNAFYYIIDDGWGKLLRQCREIDAK